MTVAGGMGESDRGGPAFNIIPKTGGNTFSGTAFASTAGEWSQGSNLDDELRSCRHHRAAGAHQELGHEPRDRRSGQARPAVVLQQPAHATGPHQDIPGLYRQRERPRRLEVELREGSRRQSAVGGGQEDRSDPPHRPAHPEEQARVLLGIPGELHRVGARQHGRWLPRSRRRLDRPRHARRRRPSPPSTCGRSGRRSRRRRGRRRRRTACCSRPAVSSFSSKWGGYIPPGSPTGLVAVTEQSTAAGVPVPQLHLSRLELGRVQQSAAQRLAGVARLRDRRAQLQGRLSGGPPGAPADPERRQPAALHVQQRHARRSSRCASARTSQSNRTRYDGFYVQDQWTHGRLTLQGGAAIRARVELVPRGRERHRRDNRFGNRVHLPASRRVSPASTTSRRAWARRTTCSGTARRR